MKRTGDCFTVAGEYMLDRPDQGEAVLVHGLPTGTGGEAGKIEGPHPHAWIEFNGFCWDPNIKAWFPRQFYYDRGNIEYTICHTHEVVRAMMQKHGTYGPWDPVLLQRDREIEELLT